jgi:hypothetical protein
MATHGKYISFPCVAFFMYAPFSIAANPVVARVVARGQKHFACGVAEIF